MNFSINGLSEEIPKLIWQTAKSYILPAQSSDTILSWVDKNPEHEWHIMDDEACERFIKENFSNEFYEMYSSLPVGVMKADVWRVAVVYAYGGIYADIDTMCVVPLKEWCKGTLVVGEETPEGNIANYMFAAIPRHPALLMVLEDMMDKWRNNQHFNTTSRTPVQDFGQHSFDRYIREYVGQNVNGATIFKYNEKKFTNFKLPTTYVWHQVASLAWKGDYERWRDKELLMRTNIK